MRVLITGAAGFVGRHLAAHLFAEGGHEIWGVSRARRVIEGLDSRMRLASSELGPSWARGEEVSARHAARLSASLGNVLIMATMIASIPW